MEIVEMGGCSLYHGDCLEAMKSLGDSSVDCIICDLPYGTTNAPWDVLIPFEHLWSQYERVIKNDGAIVLFGSEPFSTKLRASNLSLYRYDWIWEKNIATQFLDANRKPLKSHETISVFSKSQSRYFPQGLVEVDSKGKMRAGKEGDLYHKCDAPYDSKWTNYPRSVLHFDVDAKKEHPSQKPLELLRYLVKTYTEPGDLVLDNTMGSGSTGVACEQTGRMFVGMEMNDEYFRLSCRRIGDVLGKPKEYVERDGGKVLQGMLF